MGWREGGLGREDGMEGERDGGVKSFIWDSPWKHSSFNLLRLITSDEKRSRNSCTLQN